MDAFLSKSKYLNGLQCQKLLWYYYNEKESIPQMDSETQQKFDFGHSVGEYAKKLYPNGIEIEWNMDYKEVIENSKKALKKRLPIFEAGFLYNNAYSRADILNPVNDEEWDIIEVKSSTSVNETYLYDIAFQKYCYQGAGVKINRCYIAHINNSYIRQGDIEPEKLFKFVDVSEQIKGLENEMEPTIRQFLDVIKMKNSPDTKIGAHCNIPYPCILSGICWNFLPEKNIYQIKRLSADKKEILENAEIYSIYDIPEDFPLTPKNRLQLHCDKTGEIHIDKMKIKDFLGKLEYPVYFLDFETTMMTPIPLWDNTRPYQKIPFQYSVHVLSSPDAEPEHFEYLADGQSDPRREIIENLSVILKDSGTILAYFTNFEKGIIQESTAGTEYENWAQSLSNRWLDLWKPFTDFLYYNPQQKGSASLKAVLPALTGKTYSEMEIANGSSAAGAFLSLAFEKREDKEKQRIRAALLEYCGLDTLGMIDILRALKKLSDD